MALPMAARSRGVKSPSPIARARVTTFRRVTSATRSAGVSLVAP
jgi:hypothetical protein